MRRLIAKIYHRILDLIQSPEKVKARHELGYWQWRKGEEGTLSNEHYEYFYTTHFGLDRAFYNGKKVLDIGCGPRGSLEWADMVSERIGLDPLAESYRDLGTDSHAMQYKTGSAEQIPFPDGYFDVVCSFNSLDHVDDIERAVSEIIRVVSPGGWFLLLTELGHDPTHCEPVVFSWDVIERFLPHLKVIAEKHYERSRPGMYQSILAGVPYDHANESRRYGVLSAGLTKIL